MSITLTDRFIRAQITAMKVPIFEVGIYKPVQPGPSLPEPEMFLRTWDSESLLRSVGWLRLQNLRGRNLFIRPKGEHALSLLDDLTYEAVERMKSEGFGPAVVVETSPRNFQAWVNHGEVLPKNVSTLAAKVLSRRFGGDPSSADWRHFGRLAGFTNRKDKHRGPDGISPFVKLIEAGGAVYPHANTFVAAVRETCRIEQQSRCRRPFEQSRAQVGPLQTIEDFRHKPQYEEDGNRIDLAYCIYALSHGAPEGDVRAAVASRDLNHKGPPKRQAEYIERTIRKAWNTIRDRGNER